MILSSEKLRSLDHIPTAEVEADLLDAQRELNGYEVEKRTIESVNVNPTNRVRHYFLQGKIYKGQEFIGELNQVLNYRHNEASDPRTAKGN